MNCLGDKFYQYAGIHKEPLSLPVISILGVLIDSMKCSGKHYDASNPLIVPALLGGTSYKSIEAAKALKERARFLEVIGKSVIISVVETENLEDIPDDYDKFDTGCYLIAISNDITCFKVYVLQKEKVTK